MCSYLRRSFCILFITMMAETKKCSYKYCIVPMCESTTVKTPNKVYFCVPYDKAMRKQWCKLMRRDLIGPKSTKFVCEDHFDLEEDTENYIKYKIMRHEKGNEVSLRLKKGVLPHIFNCQKNKKLIQKSTGVAKRKKIELLKEELTCIDVARHSTTSEMETVYEAGPSTICEDLMKTAEPITYDDYIETSWKKEPGTVCDDLRSKDKLPEKRDRGVQVNRRPKYRSKGVNTKIKSVTSLRSSLQIPSKNASTSLFKISSSRMELFESRKACSETISLGSTYSLFSKTTVENEPEEIISKECRLHDDEFDEEFENMMRSGTLRAIEKRPELFLGLPKNSYYIIHYLSEYIPVPTIDILITLNKIKFNDSFSRLAICFGYSESNVSRIFKKTITLLANCMKELILLPDVSSVISQLPLAFRKRYSNVYSIIDCLEIEIKKPSNSIYQRLSWSPERNCNTLKYLISYTPDGLVTYISNGYGGRASHLTILEDCNLFEQLPSNIAVMSKFENICHLLQKKNCVLIRPPSISKSIASSRKEANLFKQTETLRIHVERVFDRLREFNMLLPHACIDDYFVPLMDYVLITACGIINMQDLLINN